MAEFLKQLLAAIKDYWFLITVIISGLISVGYMIIFQVNPWDTQREVKHRRKLVEFHSLAGVSLLEAGHFKQAKEEFQAALELAPTHEEALNGQYLADLFLDFDSLVWNPAVGFAIQDELKKLIKQQSLQHVIEKYLGDLSYRTNQLDKARGHYERALLLRPEYPDALCALGWFHYNEMPDMERMETYFRRMTAASAYDYQGFHGLGYALYIRALRTSDRGERIQLLHEAAKQSEFARSLGGNRFNIMVDFGEVARCIDPSLSIYFHLLAMELLEDPELANVNPRRIDAELLKSPGEVFIKGTDQLRAWINYQIALDYLAMHRLNRDPDAEKSHETYLKKALDQDGRKEIWPIYSDQLAILEDILAFKSSHAATVPGK